MFARYGICDCAPNASSNPGLSSVITKTCLTRPAFGVLVFGVFAGEVAGALGPVTGIGETGPRDPPPFDAVGVDGVAAGVAAAGVLGDEPPSAARALRSCEARPLSPPLARLLPMISAVAVAEEAITSLKRVPVTLPAVSITQRTARVISGSELLAARGSRTSRPARTPRHSWRRPRSSPSAATRASPRPRRARCRAAGARPPCA